MKLKSRIKGILLISVILIILNPIISFSQDQADNDYYIGRNIEKNPEGLIIRNITIIILPPLSKDLIPIEWVVDVGNFFHVVTKKNIIENEIGLNKNDLYKNELINEIINHLNSMKIVAGAKCYPIETGEDGTVDLIFEVVDEWSLSIDLGIGEISKYNFLWHAGIVEKNLLGMNRELGFRIEGNKPFKLALTYKDLSSLYPTEIIIEPSLNFNIDFEFDNFDLLFDLNIPLVKTLRKYGFHFKTYFINGINDSNKGEKTFYLYNENTGEYEGFLLPDYYRQTNLEFYGEFSFLIDTDKLDSLFTIMLSINSHKYKILDAIILSEVLLNQYKKTLFPFIPYNYLGFSYTMFKTIFEPIKDYDVYNKENIQEIGFKNIITIKRNDIILGSEYNSTMLRDDFQYKFGILDYLFIFVGNYFFEIDINDYSEIVTEKIGFQHVIYFRPLIIGQFITHFNIEGYLYGNNKRNVTYYLGSGDDECWVRGATKRLEGLGFINLNIEYRTNGFIKFTNRISMGFAVFYDLGVIYDDYSFENPQPLKHSIGIGIRIDAGINQLFIIDFAYEFGSNFDFGAVFKFYQVYRF